MTIKKITSLLITTLSATTLFSTDAQALRLLSTQSDLNSDQGIYSEIFSSDEDTDTGKSSFKSVNLNYRGNSTLDITLNDITNLSRGNQNDSIPNDLTYIHREEHVLPYVKDMTRVSSMNDAIGSIGGAVMYDFPLANSMHTEIPEPSAILALTFIVSCMGISGSRKTKKS